MSQFITDHPLFVFGCFVLVVAFMALVHDISQQWAKRK
jgi:hypothetical protein